MWLEEEGGGRVHKRFDGFAKSLLGALLGRHGEVISPEVAQVTPPAFLGALYTPLQADVVFRRGRSRSTDFPRLLELAGRASMWEPFSTQPDEEEVLACIEKALTCSRALRRQRRRGEEAALRLWIPVPSMTPAFKEVLEGRGFRSDEGEPAIWMMPGVWRVAVIVLSELVRDLGRPDDGLLPLLLLARGSTLRYAVERLDHLHGEEVEAMWFLVESWHRSAVRAPAMTLDPWTQELVDIMGNMLMSARQMARTEGLAEGLAEGRAEGLAEGRAAVQVELVLAALSGVEPPLSAEEAAHVADRVSQMSAVDIAALMVKGAEVLLSTLGLRGQEGSG